MSDPTYLVLDGPLQGKRFPRGEGYPAELKVETVTYELHYAGMGVHYWVTQGSTWPWQLAS